MILRTFKCLKCKHVFDLYVGREALICPYCGSHNIKKIITAPSLKFKGHGFYITDYKNK